jgi:hypothetical protein
MIDNQTYVKHIIQLAGLETTCTTSLIATFNFRTGIRSHTFKLPGYGPRQEGTVVNKSTSSVIKTTVSTKFFSQQTNMIDNQTYVKHIIQLAGLENPVDVETD